MFRFSKSIRIRRRFARYALRVARSSIHRFGVFAAEDIPAKRCVIEYRGKRLTYRQAVRSASASHYLARLNRRWIIDGAVHGSGAELINHSCNPNLRPVRKRGHLYLYTRRRIWAGEELSSDYAYSADMPPVVCHCGAKNCRGTINRKRRTNRAPRGNR
jgi:uncharacterized protein